MNKLQRKETISVSKWAKWAAHSLAAQAALQPGAALQAGGRAPGLVPRPQPAAIWQQELWAGLHGIAAVPTSC